MSRPGIRVFWSESYWAAFIDAIKGKTGMESSIFSEGVRASGCELGTLAFLKLEISARFQTEKSGMHKYPRHIAI